MAFDLGARYPCARRLRAPPIARQDQTNPTAAPTAAETALSDAKRAGQAGKVDPFTFRVRRVHGGRNQWSVIVRAADIEVE